MFLIILEIIVAGLLIGAILLQAQGTGLSSAFGGGGQIYRSKQSIEKILMTSTVVLASLFAIISVILLIPR